MQPAESHAERRRLSFGTVAELYDRARPGYPTALVDDVLEYAAAGATPAAGGAISALEVGAGTGKATVAFAARGLAIRALEPDRAMAALAAENCVCYPAVTIERAELESAALDPGAVGLVYSAQAWHWIDPERRYQLARSTLSPGGTLAVFWNIADWTRCRIAQALQGAYVRTGVELPDHGPMVPRERSRLDLGDEWTEQIAAADGLSEARTAVYRWSASYGSSAYVELLRTHSDHLLLPEIQREALMVEIAAVIDAHGGVLELPYATLLCLARAG